ncbi:MAG: threonine/serine dehydratase [Xanthobacteraceae bacterium]|nr:threonine/serine dehydratase [Xanthobacteraceae bacterium]MBX3524120.1 threonine/serine dehydratase [Xanthobacteraceae bacterium]MCW5675713.1 threonine/serine dehydratase [Xanthobacteraceae bacterium]
MHSPAAIKLPTAADVEDAARALKGVAVRTPLLRCDPLDELAGGKVFLKPEMLQRTGSFKFRGAYNRISRLTAEEKKGGIVAYSSGNHAQGVALAAKLVGVKAAIIMPRDAPKLKQERTKGHGAEVILYDRATEDRDAIGRKLAAERGAVVVPPFDDFHVIAGQGTIGLEIADDLAALDLAPDIVTMPASGGGLAAGISLSIKARHPQARIVTAEPELFDDHARSFKSGKREKNERVTGSICDALLMADPGKLTFEITRELSGEGVSASDEEVLSAMAFAFRELKLVVEPGGAVALAAILSRKIDVKGKVAVAVLSGGNADPDVFARAITAY